MQATNSILLSFKEPDVKEPDVKEPDVIKPICDHQPIAMPLSMGAICCKCGKKIW